MAETTGFTIWLTGMSGAGKSTLARFLANRLAAAGRRVEILDEEQLALVLGRGDPARREDRDTYLRRIGWVAGALTRNEVVAIVAATSPYRELRDTVRREIGRFVEVFCDCPVDLLIERDVKGLYKKALAGEIPNFTGITEPYEPPTAAEVMLDSGRETVEASGEHVISTLRRLGLLRSEEAGVALFGRTKAAARLTRKAARAAGDAHTPRKATASPRKKRSTAEGGAPALRTGEAQRAGTVSRRTRRAARVATSRHETGAAEAPKKASGRKTSPKQAPARKTTSGKAPAKKAPPARKAPAKKTAATKAPAKKTASRKAPAKKAPKRGATRK